MTTTPTEIPPRLQEMLTPSMGAPTFVDVRPRLDSILNDCTEDVRKQVEEHGGGLVTGWTVWELPNAFLSTEFHTIWKSPTGELLDVSAKVDGETSILFIPDSSIRYTGDRIHGAHLPLSDDPVVLEHIKAHEAYRKAFDQTYGADFLGFPYPHPDMAAPTLRHVLATQALERVHPQH